MPVQCEQQANPDAALSSVEVFSRCIDLPDYSMCQVLKVLYGYFVCDADNG